MNPRRDGHDRDDSADLRDKAASGRDDAARERDERAQLRDEQGWRRERASRDRLRAEGLACSVSEEGAVTLDEGLAWFDCTVYREVEAGDHVVVLLRLHGVEQADAGSPLVFHHSGFGRLAVQ